MFSCDALRMSTGCSSICADFRPSVRTRQASHNTNHDTQHNTHHDTQHNTHHDTQHKRHDTQHNTPHDHTTQHTPRYTTQHTTKHRQHIWKHICSKIQMAMQFKHFNASHYIVLLTIHYAIIDVFENTLLRVYFNMQRANEILNSI